MKHSSYNGRQIEEIINAKLISNDPDSIIIKDILIDSRRLISAKKTMFFALSSKKNDGHNYINELYNKGVRTFVVNNDYNTSNYNDASFFKVDNTLDALQLLTTHHRLQFDLQIIGITGSNGKTVIKEWLFQLMNFDRKIVRSPKSYNSQIGVPLSVWQINKTHELGIFEAGISEPEEMEKLQRIILPEIGIFTNIGQAHDENFINTTQKTGEKLNLFKKVKTLIYNSDHKEVKGAIIRSGILENISTFSWGKDDTNDLIITDHEIGEESTVIKGIYSDKKVSIEIPMVDAASIENACHCWATMLLLGYGDRIINSRMKLLGPVAMRLELKEGVNNCTIINDAYNSDYNSFSIALNFLNQQNQHKNKVVILSDIMQSGQNSIDLYTNVAELLEKANIDQFIGIGEEVSSQRDKFNDNSLFFNSTDAFISSYPLSNFANQTILLKGARKFEFERLSKILQQKAHETVLEINLDMLVSNLNYFKETVKPKTKIMAMVKAFSYGTGSFEIANTLNFHNIDYLSVAYADEGIELRKAGINLPIMVMSPEEHAFDSMIRHQLEPEIFSFRTLDLLEHAISKTALPQNKPVKIHIKIDTGMNRLGFDPDEAEEIIRRVNDNQLIYVQSVFSHLAGSDNPDLDEFTRTQIRIFEAIKEKFKNRIENEVLFHIANSAGAIRFPESHMDMIRPGIGLYGIMENNDKLSEVLSLRSVISQIKIVKKGESVGYNRSWVAEKDTKVGTVSIGYADGILRSLGNGNSKLWISGKPAPVIGDICMDMCMVNLEGIDALENDNVIIFDNEHSVYNLAKAANTIPYELLSRISRRVKRVYYHE